MKRLTQDQLSAAFEALVVAVRELSLTRNLQAVMDITKRAARQITGAHGTTFVLRDGDLCHYADEDAIGPLWKGQRFSLKACVSGWTMLNKTHAAIENIFDDPRIPQDAYKTTFVKSLVMVPIRSESPIGAIGVYWATHHEAVEPEIRLLQALADTVSVALENLRLYESLEQRIKELDRANKIKDEFLMTLSHELRTPLNAILGWAQLLSNGPLDPSDHSTAIETIERNARAQANLINDLLDMTRIVAGRFQIESKPVDLSRVIRTAIGTIQLAADNKLIRISAPGLDEFIGVVTGDEQRLQQVVSNLLSNAVKFTLPRGKVEVRLAQEGPSARIDVSDNGAGLDHSFIPSIFERFRQANSSSTRKYGGLGLGLSIVRHLAEAHGGRVQAESAGLGHGSTFTVFLPLTSADQRQARIISKTEPAPLPSLSGLRILAIDDEADVRILISRILGKQGAVVRTVSTSDEAFAVMKEFEPHMLICDLSMPDVDGYAVIQKLRKMGQDSMASIPAIALTAYADKESERTALASGFTTFMGKPFQVGRLVEVIKASALKSA